MLFEIWSLGKKPYQGLRNEHVSELHEREALHTEALHTEALMVILLERTCMGTQGCT